MALRGMRGSPGNGVGPDLVGVGKMDSLAFGLTENCQHFLQNVHIAVTYHG